MMFLLYGIKRQALQRVFYIVPDADFKLLPDFHFLLCFTVLLFPLSSLTSVIC